jgi:folate-binding protein YgfZ
MPQQTPLHAAEARTGATFTEEAGWLVPANFGDARAEYRQTREKASVFDLSHHGKIELRGPDAKMFLHNVCTNNILALQPGQGCEAFLATVKAKLVAHIFVYCAESPDAGLSLWLHVAPGAREKVIKHLDRHLISEKVEILDRTPDFAQLHLAGPDSPSVLAQALGKDLPDLETHQYVGLRLPGQETVRLRRHDRLAVRGDDLLIPAANAETFWQTLLAAGARPAGAEAYELMRIEAGMPREGVDITEDNLVMEIGRNAEAISYTKGCYLGQEPIVRARDLGHVNWSFRGLRIDGSEPVAPGAKLFREGKEVGRVTSAAFSPRLEVTVALGFVRRGSDAPQTKLEIDLGAAARTAEVASLPFGG